MVTVRCFAGVREILGREALTFTPPEGTFTAADVLTSIAGNRLGDLPQPLLVAINLEHASLASAVCDGDEIAFFPPVSGG